MITIHSTKGMGIYKIEQDHFPDGTLNLRLPENVPEDSITSITWDYENDSELFTIIALKKHYESSKDITLEMWYIPHARMDRVKNKTDVFTLKWFAQVINSLNFKEVITLDAHSNVALALIDRIHNYPPTEFVREILKDDTVLFFPDEGAMKRYSVMFNKPYAFGMKKREWETGKIKSLDIINSEVVKDKNVLIVDDICSKGGTFLHSAKALKAAGAKKIELFVSHCEHTVFDGEMITSGLIDHIYTTTSIFKREWETPMISVVA